MRALDVNEIHGYRADLGLRVFTADALAKHARIKLSTAAE
jgi:arginine decarboxylase